MQEASADKTAPRVIPPISIPGGLLLLFCLFLPAVKGCDKPVYPYEIPVAYAPYLFGLLAAALGVFRSGRAAKVLRTLTWALSSIAALAEGYFFVSGLKTNNHAELRFLVPALLLWVLLTINLLESVRWREKAQLWRALLLSNGGGLCLLFFLFFAAIERVYYGMWLSILGSASLVLEGVWSWHSLRRKA